MPPVLLSTEVKCWASIFSLIESNWDEYPLPESDIRIPKLPSWQEQAACKELPESVFFGAKDPKKRPSITMKEIKTAKKICIECPVFEDCLLHALTQREEYGIWAGTSGRTRARIWEMLSTQSVTISQVISDYTNGDTHRYESNRGGYDY